MELIAFGENVLPAGVVGGRVQRFESVEDVLAFLDNESQGVVALTPFAGSTFLSPILENLTAIVTITGTRTGHLAIVSREFQIPCVLQTQITAELDGHEVLLDARDVSIARIYRCPTSLLVALRGRELSSRADLESVVEPSSSTTLDDALSLLEAAGYVEARSGEPTRYALADKGRDALERYLAGERWAAGSAD
jgi:phosphohistidine swiveling domain-containing protein